MRCIAFWEMAQRKGVVIEDVSASTCYADAMTSYDDVPNLTQSKYKWNDRFDLEAFEEHIDGTNYAEICNWIMADLNGRLFPQGVEEEGELPEFQRMSYAPTVDALLSKKKDILMQVLLPCDFAVYANDVVSRAQARAGLPEMKLLQSAVSGFYFLGASDPQTNGLFFWRIGKELMWQHLDPSVDKVFERLP
ncbi:hypothetical protein C8R44DRAFT_988807 [Mycena epipterygia]|nr:hypothetical protein C8R44DRAFT_988807 [Mycena epipterygia]